MVSTSIYKCISEYTLVQGAVILLQKCMTIGYKRSKTYQCLDFIPYCISEKEDTNVRVAVKFLPNIFLFFQDIRGQQIDYGDM